MRLVVFVIKQLPALIKSAVTRAELLRSRTFESFVHRTFSQFHHISSCHSRVFEESLRGLASLAASNVNVAVSRFGFILNILSRRGEKKTLNEANSCCVQSLRDRLEVSLLHKQQSNKRNRLLLGQIWVKAAVNTGRNALR